MSENDKTIAEIEAEAIHERRKKRFLKIFITEFLMVFGVVSLVGVSLLLTMGYAFNTNENEDDVISQSGLLAIQSKPTGATVTIDGTQMFAWTNMSRTVAKGEHTVVLNKEGYYPWEKTVSVQSGLMYRLNYPRLFLKNGEIQEIKDFSEVDYMSVAHDENTMLVVYKNGEMVILNINEEKPTEKKLDASVIFPEKYVGGLEVMSWSGNNRKAIVKYDGKKYLLNIADMSVSVNLTDKYGMDFSELEFIDDAGDRILALQDGNLREIQVNAEKISNVIHKNVISFDNNYGDIVMVVKDTKGKNVEVLRSGETESVVIEKNEECEDACKMLATLGEYYGDKYVGITMGNRMIVYMGELPKNTEKEIGPEVVADTGMDFAPETLEFYGNGEFLVAMNGDNNQMAIFDTEAENVVKNTTDRSVKCVDEGLFAGVKNGEMIVMDVDMKNQISLVPEGVSDRGEIKISRNEKWIYFLTSDGKLSRLTIMN